MEYKNTKEVSLMMWETNPQLRNKNNIVKVNVKKTINLEIGDIIFTVYGDIESCFEVEEIISSRQSALTDYNYLEVKTKWHNRQAAVL